MTKRFVNLFKENINKILILFIAIFIFAQFVFVFYSNINYDERIHSHIAYLIHEGEFPYLNFFAHHMPLFYFLISLAFYLPPIMSIFALRIVMFSLSMGVVFLVYKITLRDFSKTSALFACLLLVTFRQFFLSSFMIRPDVLASFLIVLSFYLITLQNKKDFSYIWMGLFLAASLFVHLKSVFFIFPLCLIIVFSRPSAKQILLLISGSAIAALITLSLFSFSISKISAFYFLTIKFNFQISGGNPVIYNLITYFAVNLFFMAALFASLIDLNYIKNNWKISLMVLFSILFLGYSSVKGLLGPQYLLFALPFLSIFSAPKTGRLFTKVNLSWLLVLFFLLFGIIIPISAAGFEFHRANLSQDIRELEFSIKNSSSSAVALDQGWLIFKKNAHFLWFEQFQHSEETLIKNGVIDDFNLTKIIEAKPEFIKSDFFNFNDKDRELINQSYIKTDFPGLYRLKNE